MIKTKSILKLTLITFISLVLIIISFLIINFYQSQGDFPDNDLKLLGGEMLDSNTFDGKIKIVNVWGTWCASCIKEIPRLNQLKAESANDKSVLFLALPGDKDIERLNKFFIKKPFHFLQLDPSNETYFIKGIINGYPTTLVYGKNGELIKKWMGELDENRIDKIKSIIAKANNSNGK